MGSNGSPEERLMRQVKAGFVAQGTSYTRWCRENGIAASGVRQVIYGTWAGPKGKALKRRVLRAAGVKEAA